MIVSLLIILVGGFISGYIINKIKIPSIVGMIIYGLLIGPSFLNIISSSVIDISGILRQIALVIIITRAGLNLDFQSIKEQGTTAILMSFLPATFEIIGVAIFAPIILKISVVEGVLIGTILAAVSPAIIVPRMIKLKEEGYKKISELVLIGSSADDIYVIILFYAFLGMVKNNVFSFVSIIQIPTSIILGVVLGIIFGYIINKVLSKIKINGYIQILTLLTISILMVVNENKMFNIIKVSTLLSVLSLNMYLKFKDKENALFLEEKYKKLWFIFEIILFVLVGISLDFSYVTSDGFSPIIVILIGLVFRTIGVFLTLSWTNFSKNEKLFIVFAYLPKATVQASIGGIALFENLPIGSRSLTIAVLSILITAPIGALLIDNTYKKLLIKDLEFNNIQ